MVPCALPFLEEVEVGGVVCSSNLFAWRGKWRINYYLLLLFDGSVMQDRPDQDPDSNTNGEGENARGCGNQFAADREEFEALGRIAHAFREYKTEAEWILHRWEYNYSKYVVFCRLIVTSHIHPPLAHNNTNHHTD